MIAEHTSINAYNPVRASTGLLAPFMYAARHSLRGQAIVPRDGANIVADLRVPVLTVSVNRVGRRERHDVESLKRQHGGDVKMPDLLAALVAGCPRTRSFSIYDRCKAVYEGRG